MATPIHHWHAFDIEKGRTSSHQFTLYKENGNAFALAASDVVRFKLWLSPSGDDEAPALDVDSVGATANGSIVTIDGVGSDDVTAATVTVKLGQDDTDGLLVQEYMGELCHVDDSETNPLDAIKRIAFGPVNVRGSSTGDVGKT